MGLDHGLQHGFHGQRCFTVGHSPARKVIRHGQDPAQVIRRVPPFRRQPGVVVVQPAHDTPDIPGRLYRVQLERRTRDPGTMGHQRTLNQRPEVLGAFRETQCQQSTPQGIHQAIAGCGPGFLTIDWGVQHIVCNRLDHLVIVRADILVGVGVGVHRTSSMSDNSHDHGTWPAADQSRLWEGHLINRRRDMEDIADPVRQGHEWGQLLARR